MKGLSVLAAGLFLSVSLAAVANAAPSVTSENAAFQQGVKNSRKAMQSKRERDSKMRETKKKAYAARKLAQSGK